MTTEFNPARWMCAASGCPLPGGLTESVRGADAWYCRFHFLCPPDAVNGITKSLYETKGMSAADVKSGVEQALAQAKRNLFTPAREFEEAFP